MGIIRLRPKTSEHKGCYGKAEEVLSMGILELKILNTKKSGEDRLAKTSVVGTTTTESEGNVTNWPGGVRS